MFLTESLVNTLIYENRLYELNMSFDNILRLTELLDDDDFTDLEKTEIAFEMIVESESNLNALQKHEFIMMFLKDVLGFIKDGESSESSEPMKKEYDLAIDGERIYASFLMDYGIDLIDMQGRLHWKKFLILLSGLSEKTPFMQVVNIRTQEVTTQTKHNAKEVARIRRLKQKYALEQPDLQDGLNQAATFLKRHAKVGE